VVAEYGARLQLRIKPHDLRRYAECRIMPNSVIEAAMASSLAAGHAA
jgi:hypothetical protein